jgi:hypothetical protein
MTKDELNDSEYAALKQQYINEQRAQVGNTELDQNEYNYLKN